jgi:hypothetical protein
VEIIIENVSRFAAKDQSREEQRALAVERTGSAGKPKGRATIFS